MTFLSPLGLNPPVGRELPLIDFYLGGTMLLEGVEDKRRSVGEVYEGAPGFELSLRPKVPVETLLTDRRS